MMNIKVALGSATVLACALVGCGSDDDGSSSADAETVIVANGNADNGSAGRMTDALRLAGFSTGEAVNSQDKVADSIVYYSDANGSQDVAVKVAVALGGVDVESLPDPAPTDSGSLDGGGVLLLLGQNQADKTLEELNGGGGSTGGGSSTGGGTTGTTPVGGTVKCDRESLTKANENADPNFVKLVDWNCDQGWAVTTINTKDVTDEKTVVKAEGQFWIPAPSGYCGTVNPEDPTTIPDDATIPAKLYPDACV
ncbi:MAG: hypothetical protein GKR86_15470 [Ilumatobacter sp.]|nr:hypothetical protein [Ilumatobacter sp.]